MDAELDISEDEVRASDRGDEEDNELDVDAVLFVVELVVEAVFRQYRHPKWVIAPT